MTGRRQFVIFAVAALSTAAAIRAECVSFPPAHVRGRISESAKFERLHPLFAKAFAFLCRPDLADLKCGRHEIDGTNCWAMVQEVSLKPFSEENQYEVHRAFIDIQMPITGSETIGVTKAEPRVLDGFNAENDYALFKAKGEPWTLGPDEFAVFFPENGAHAPGLCFGGSRKIRKVVVKVLASVVELPVVDISGETNRHVIVAAGTEDIYQGHPTTVLSDDGKRLFCVWTLNHGGKCGPAAESLDGGRTWKRVDGRLPAVYAATHMNCPTLQKLTTPEGRERWLIFSRKGEWDRASGSPGRLGVMASDDCGLTWRESGVFDLPAAMPPTGFIQLKDGSCALFGQERKNPKVQNDGAENDQVIWMSISRDGGITWGERRTVAAADRKNLCEPFALRSPDGNEICLLLRENRHTARSMMCFSRDEGKTWTKPVDTCWGLTGDRHEGVMLPDGRWVIAFRDRAIESSSYGQYVAWVGTYEDIRNASPGQYRIKLLHGYSGDKSLPNHTVVGDVGYSGVELLPTGEIVCTTYIKYWPDARRHSVVSTRFVPTETDRKGLISLHPQIAKGDVK